MRGRMEGRKYLLFCMTVSLDHFRSFRWVTVLQITLVSPRMHDNGLLYKQRAKLPHKEISNLKGQPTLPQKRGYIVKAFKIET